MYYAHAIRQKHAKQQRKKISKQLIINYLEIYFVSTLGLEPRTPTMSR